MRRRSVRLLALTGALGLGLGACNNAPSDLRVWRATDHDHTTNPGAAQVVGGPDAGPSPELAQAGLDEVTLVAWRQNCVRCHGALGRGDGPQGRMLNATDLTRRAYQEATDDTKIATTIRQGRGAMPPFPLPDSTVESLVRLVRLLGKASAEEAQPAASGSAPGPSESAKPASSAPPRPTAARLVPTQSAPRPAPEPAPSP
jgi:mono/diheme cytochrome c family protein